MADDELVMGVHVNESITLRIVAVEAVDSGNLPLEGGQHFLEAELV